MGEPMSSVFAGVMALRVNGAVVRELPRVSGRDVFVVAWPDGTVSSTDAEASAAVTRITGAHPMAKRAKRSMP